MWRLTADPIPESLEALKNELQSKAESLCNLPENALRRAYDELTKVQSGQYELVPVRAPETKINTRGRPTGSKKNWSKSKSTQRDPSGFEYLKAPEPKATKPKAPRPRAPPKCSKCKSSGHNKKKCPLVPQLHEPTLAELQLDPDADTPINITNVDQSATTLRPELDDGNSNLNSDNRHRFDWEEDKDNSNSNSDAQNRSDWEEDNDNIPKCPFCDDPLPSQPSPKLHSLMQMLLDRPKAKKTPRPGNPDAVSLPMSETIAFCVMHGAEEKYIPIGKQNGWPSSINFDELSSRVEKFVPDLQHIINHQIDSTFLNGALQILQSHGARRMDSVWHGDLTFELEQPGYYGGRGLEIIYQTLHSQFLRPQAPNRLLHAKAKPLSPETWVRTVLIPEVSLRLIADDLKISISDPKVKDTLESSRAYGMAIFPAEDDHF
ncbi:uncharacterized protein MELLADRAFT_94792 [Melampsora larici-populina 98AG31]|uniref:Restriction of telomere capping protein 4 n=1 Tax=Melampsora larici-populina (strain 98AG31 / pathotype 3-4-7) TaxID=747676 RepID=F4S7Y0_MELLP|nr:uncharacterized protein MELLADRAFT_94792 [Melampsora larici-populina 98AG31]EGF99249.1 hypothetical protein MELLADRAFT_94792 [Melampsora larici-populina 98AG31]